MSCFPVKRFFTVKNFYPLFKQCISKNYLDKPSSAISERVAKDMADIFMPTYDAFKSFLVANSGGTFRFSFIFSSLVSYWLPEVVQKCKYVAIYCKLCHTSFVHTPLTATHAKPFKAHRVKKAKLLGSPCGSAKK
jgi:hypothetical protein